MVFPDKLESTWCSIYKRLLYFSCNDDILGIFPTIIFITSIGVVLYKDGYQNSIEDSQQQFLQMLLLLGLFIFTVRTWLFSIKVLKWTIKQMLKMATCNSTEQYSIKGLLEVFQEQEDFVHLTLCFAFALIPANYVCDTKLYQFYFKHVQHVVPTSMTDVNTLTSISATSFIVQICEILLYCAFGHCGGILQIVLKLLPKESPK